VGYRKKSTNSNRDKYNIERYKNFLNLQDRNNYIQYIFYFSPEVEEELNLKKGSDYSDRVYKLIWSALNYPRADEIVDSTLESFTCVGFDIPEATHPRPEYDNKRGGYEVWSKDIDKENRLLYRIYDELEIIYFISIIGHDLDSNKKIY
jgi:hypothetical protein